MERHKAAIVGGLIAGVVTTVAMVAGRKSGVLTKTLDRDAVDWIDRLTGSRDVIGDAGTSVVEFANHLGASAAFGAAIPTLRDLAPSLSPAALGAVLPKAKSKRVRARPPSAGPCTCCRASSAPSSRSAWRRSRTKADALPLNTPAGSAGTGFR
jgi:hypothetical protein